MQLNRRSLQDKWGQHDIVYSRDKCSWHRKKSHRKRKTNARLTVNLLDNLECGVIFMNELKRGNLLRIIGRFSRLGFSLLHETELGRWATND